MTSGETLDRGSGLPSPGGLVLSPFRALRYTPRAGDLSRLLSPPYDVVDADEQRRLEAADPHNVVRLILPRDGEDTASEVASRYARAAAALAAWRADGVLAADDEPALYVYELREGDTTTRGLLGALSLTRPDEGIVLPHENTMAGPVADRLALTEAVQANLEPIYLVYDGGGAASRAVADAGATPSLATAVTDDGVEHRLWALRDADVLAAVAEDLRPRRAVIADGHHRYATYLRHQEEQRAAGAGTGPWDRGLTFLVDATAFGPQVHAIHRVVAGLPLVDAVTGAAAGFTVRELPDRLAALDALAEAGKTGHAYLLSDGTRWHLLTDPHVERLAAALPADRARAWRELDVTVAHRYLVEQLWGLADREDVVDFKHDVNAALAAAATAGGTALLLNPTPVDQVIAVAAAGERMPRKSTLFTPKPRSGLVLRAYADATAER